MTKPTLEEFIASTREALARAEGLDKQVCVSLDGKGSSFHFYDDGGLDSLGMLGVALSIEGDLGVRIDLEMITKRMKPMTLQNLYDAIQWESKIPA